MRIDRCYCYQKTFEELQAVAEATGADTVEALQEHAVFGHNCQLCHRYVRRMLRTGETVFHDVIDAADAPSAEGEPDRPSDA